jgi:hypothetical protein
VYIFSTHCIALAWASSLSLLPIILYSTDGLERLDIQNTEYLVFSDFVRGIKHNIQLAAVRVLRRHNIQLPQ